MAEVQVFEVPVVYFAVVTSVLTLAGALLVLLVKTLPSSTQKGLFAVLIMFMGSTQPNGSFGQIALIYVGCLLWVRRGDAASGEVEMAAVTSGEVEMAAVTREEDMIPLV